MLNMVVWHKSVFSNFWIVKYFFLLISMLNYSDYIQTEFFLISESDVLVSETWQ